MTGPETNLMIEQSVLEEVLSVAMRTGGEFAD